MLTAFTGGMLIASSSCLAALFYLPLGVLLLFLSESKGELFLRIIKIQLFLFCMYLIGSMSFSTPAASWLTAALYRSLPLLVSTAFVLIMLSPLKPGDIQRGTHTLFRFIPFIPARQVSFMAAMSYRFLIEAVSVLKSHRQHLHFRKRASISYLEYGQTLLLSPLLLLFSRAEQLSEAYVFRNTHTEDAAEPLELGGVRFWVTICFLFAIKIVSIYTV